MIAVFSVWVIVKMEGNTCEPFRRMVQFLELWNVILLLMVHSSNHGKFTNFISRIIAQIIVWTFHMKRIWGMLAFKKRSSNHNLLIMQWLSKDPLSLGTFITYYFCFWVLIFHLWWKKSFVRKSRIKFPID